MLCSAPALRFLSAVRGTLSQSLPSPAGASSLAADQEAAGERHQGAAEAVRDLGRRRNQRRWEREHALQRPGSHLRARAEGEAHQGGEWGEREESGRSGTASPAGLLGSAEEHHPPVSARLAKGSSLAQLQPFSWVQKPQNSGSGEQGLARLKATSLPHPTCSTPAVTGCFRAWGCAAPLGDAGRRAEPLPCSAGHPAWLRSASARAKVPSRRELVSLNSSGTPLSYFDFGGQPVYGDPSGTPVTAQGLSLF